MKIVGEKKKKTERERERERSKEIMDGKIKFKANENRYFSSYIDSFAVSINTANIEKYLHSHEREYSNK